jgi:hypothetical protein
VAPLSVKIWRALVSAGAAAAALTLCAPAAAQPTDTAVKAAFLPRFAKYVTWPPAAMPRGSDPFVLCVIGSDPFGAMLDEAARSQTVEGRRIVVRRMDSPAQADHCQIAFLGTGRGPSSAVFAGKPVLTVTDGSRGAQRGIVNFELIGGRVRFFIDQGAAEDRGLGVSSRLLALAVGVR